MLPPAPSSMKTPGASSWVLMTTLAMRLASSAFSLAGSLGASFAPSLFGALLVLAASFDAASAAAGAAGAAGALAAPFGSLGWATAINVVAATAATGMTRPTRLRMAHVYRGTRAPGHTRLMSFSWPDGFQRVPDE